MSEQAVEALAAERALALDLAGSLTAAEWATQSDCAGWRVQDVFAHMAAVAHGICDPASMARGGTDDAEANAEVGVDERRGWSSADVLAEYEQWSETLLGVFAGMQKEPSASTVIPLGNLGSHPLHILANAIVFDHYCHLRHDLVAPGGPLTRSQLPSDDFRLTPTMEWMLGGLPQMCSAAMQGLDRPLVLSFGGSGGGTWTLAPGSPLITVTEGSESATAATVRSTAHDFVQWGTKRRDWRASCTVVGDTAYAAAILDGINVI